MALYIGSKRLTGTTGVYLGTHKPSIYIGSFLTYPEATTYQFRNGTLRYSSGSIINAAGSNYAYYTADVLTYVGGQYSSSAANVTLSCSKVSGDSAFSVDVNNHVNAANRSNVTGSSRSATFRASYGNTSAATFTVNQESNSAYPREKTTGLTAVTATYLTYAGGDYYMPCLRAYNYWTGYTSGYQSSTGNTTGMVTAMTYLDTENYNWVTTASTSANVQKLVVSQNYGDSNRSATIRAAYSASTDTAWVTSSFSFTQYRRPYSTYEYRISSYGITNDTWDGTVSGTSYTETITATSQYRTTTWRDGNTTTGNWTDYTGRPDLCGNQKPTASVDYYEFLLYPPNGSPGQYSADMYYPTTATTYGQMRVYPAQLNTSTSSVTQNVMLIFGNTLQTIQLTHTGEIRISVSPTSLAIPATGGTKTFTVSSNVSGWSVSATSSWFTTSVNGNTVSVSAPDNIEAIKYCTMNIMYGGTSRATCSVSQAVDSASVPGIFKLFDLGHGWIVGRVKVSVVDSQPIYMLLIARNDVGSNTTFTFNGTYTAMNMGTHQIESYPLTGTRTYTGTRQSVTDYDTGTSVQFYGVQMVTGVLAYTTYSTAGITMS